MWLFRLQEVRSPRWNWTCFLPRRGGGVWKGLCIIWCACVCVRQNKPLDGGGKCSCTHTKA